MLEAAAAVAPPADRNAPSREAAAAAAAAAASRVADRRARGGEEEPEPDEPDEPPPLPDLLHVGPQDPLPTGRRVNRPCAETWRKKEETAVKRPDDDDGVEGEGDRLVAALASVIAEPCIITQGERDESSRAGRHDAQSGRLEAAKLKRRSIAYPRWRRRREEKRVTVEENRRTPTL